MTNVTEKRVLTTTEVQKNEQVSYRSLMRHIQNLGKGRLLYDKYRVYKVGRTWRFEMVAA